MHGYGARVASISEPGICVDVAVLDVRGVCHGHAFLAVLLFRLSAAATIHARVNDAADTDLDETKIVQWAAVVELQLL